MALPKLTPVRVPVLAAAVLLTAAAPAPADWLVTREGARVETRGTWQQKGKLVVFTLPDGTLSSLRADQVDLDASRQATTEAQKEKAIPPPPAAAPRRPSVRSFTDKDFRQAGQAPAAAEGTTGSAPGEAAASAAGQPAAGAPAAEGATAATPAPESARPQGDLEVVTWERVDGYADGVRLTGMLRNNSTNQVTGVELVAGLYDETGALLVRKDADLEVNHLKPGESTPFTVDVPGTFAYSGVRFQTRKHSFKLRAVPPAPTDGPSS